MSVTRRFKSWLHEQKDASLALVLETGLRKQLERYGQVLDLEIDSRKRTAQVQVLLKGEKDPVAVAIDEYLVDQDATGTFLVVNKARASREWLTQALSEFVVGRRFAVPEKYAGWVKMLLR